jgi:hypothetical protein
LSKIGESDSPTNVNKMIPFYTSMIMGSEEQCRSYAKTIYGLAESDDSRIKQISEVTAQRFNRDQSQRLMDAIPEFTTYGDYNHKQEVLHQYYQLLETQTNDCKISEKLRATSYD